jgi:hypothetical protein
MISQTPAKIYLADNRTRTENMQRRTFSTIGNQAEEDNSVATMYAFDDTELAGGARISVGINRPSYLLLLPITGDLDYIDETGKTMTIHNGKALVIQVTADFSLANPFADEVVNYLQVLLQSDQAVMTNLVSRFCFDLEADKNKLITWEAAELPFSFNIGRFDGRTEGLYTLKNTGSTVFSFIITGAFELEHRLLQQHDGLVMNNLKEFEFEALSDHAILWCMEIFGHPIPHLGN